MMRRPLTLALCAANVALAALALWPFLPESAHSERVPVLAGAGADAPTLQRLPPLADFGATLERPLFSPSRRPQAVAVRLGAGIETRYRLQGLVIAGTERRALIAATDGGRTLALGEGDGLEGWVVKRIEQDRVVLTSPAGEAVLAVRQGGGAPAPIKPPAKP
jgi:hypothetical protein